MSVQIDPDDWLRVLCGKTESSLLARDDNWSPNSRQCDNFTQYSLWELRRHLASQFVGSTTEKRRWPDFVIRLRKPKNSENALFDTSALQLTVGSSDGRPAMFQVASNFNCHENSSVLTNIYDGKYLTRLMTDATQGPCAAAGAGIGAIQRWQEHRRQPINLLSNLHIFDVQNGKLTNVNSGTEAVDFEQTKVGLHANVDANFDRSQRKSCQYWPKAPRKVDQVFVSTISMRLFRNSCNRVRKAAEVAERKLLRAAYQGTYMLARVRKTSVLVLTLVGGGVFENAIEDIALAIADAHVEHCSEQGTALETVLLPIYAAVDHKCIIKTLIAQGCPESSIKIKYA